MAVVPTGGFRADRVPGAPAPLPEAGAPPPARYRPTNDERLADATAEAFGVIARREVAQREAASEATRSDPDIAARANRIAPWKGVPPRYIEERIGDYDQEMRADAVRSAMDRSPELGAWFSDPRRTAATHDDIDPLERVTAPFAQVGNAAQLYRGAPDPRAPYAAMGSFEPRAPSGPVARTTRPDAATQAIVAQAGRRDQRAREADGFLSRMGAFASSGLASVESGLFSIGGALQEWSANTSLPWLSDAANARNRADALAASGQLRERARVTREQEAVRGGTSWETVKGSPTLGNIGSFVAEQGVASVPGMVLTAINPFAFGASQAGNIGQQRAEYNNRADATLGDVIKATPAAAASAVLEHIGITKIFGAAGSSAAVRIGQAAAGEGATEFAQTMVEQAGGTLGTDRGFDVVDALDQSFAAALAGAGTGGTIRGVQEGTSRIATRVVEVIQARQGIAVIDKIMGDAAESKTRQRDPRLFEEFIDGISQGTPLENMFIPAEAIRELYQSNGWDMGQEDDGIMSGLTGDFWKQVEAGIASGGDVVIPMSAVAAHLAGTPVWEQIKPSVRVSPGGISQKEVEAFESEYADVVAKIGDTVREQAAAEREAAAPREKVFDAVLSQAREAGFSINAARSYADLWADRYATRAERLGDGRNAFDLFQQSFAGIRQDLPDRLKPYRKGDGLDVLINAVRTGAQPMTPRAKSLIETIVDGGGVNDDGGDILSMGGDSVVSGGIFGRKRKSLIRDQSADGQASMLPGSGSGNDYSLDAWAQRLQSQGFFGDMQGRATTNDLLDAIGQELRGDPVYPTEAVLDPVMEANNAILAAADDLRELLDRLGVDIHSATRDEIDAAIARWEAEGDAAFGFDQSAVDTQSEAFKRWFGESKVVDGNGNPLTMYHGTRADIKAFDKDRVGERFAGFSIGIHFSSNPKEASLYADSHANLAENFNPKSRFAKDVEPGANVIPVYLKVENPLIIDSGAVLAASYADNNRREIIEKIVASRREAAKDPVAEAAAIDELLAELGVTDAPKTKPADPKKPYDGIIIRSSRGDEFDAQNVIVFEPTQIKSAIGNSGSFDPADPRILHQSRDQGGARGRIDFLADNRAQIVLFQNRDLSTLLHEGGHLWLEELRSDALSTVGREDASPEARKLFGDWEAVKAWFKGEGIDVNDGEPIPTEAHELWARGMERYFMEGKAPSRSLQTAFASFRAWLLRIYKVVRNLRSNIDDDVRRVMDRLLATDTAISWAIHESDERALFETVVPEGMTGQERLAYMGLVEQSRTEAFDALLYRTMERVRRSRTARYQEEEAKVRAEVAADVEARPEFQAMRLIRGVGVDHMPLDLDGVIARIGRDAVPLLPKSAPNARTVVANGVNPDIVAEHAGFPDGKTMLEALIGVEERRRALIAANDKRNVQQEAVDLETERRMAERHGDIFDDGSIEEEALEIIQTDAGSERLASEIRQLARAIDPKEADGPPTPLDVIRSYAERVVREGRIVDQASGAAVERHRKAKAKASREAERSYLNGDNVVALKAKQREMIASELWRAAKNAKDQVDVIARRLDRFARTRNLKGMDQDYLDRIHEVLESYDLRPRSRDEIRERERFTEWAKREAEKGFEVFVPERLTMAGNKHFTRLTFEEIVAIDDTVQSLAHLGRQKMELLIGQEEQRLEDMVQRAEAAALALPMRKFSDARNEERSLIRDVDSSLVKMEFIADQLDGGDPNGVFNEVLVKGATQAANEKERLTRQVVDPLAKLYLDMPKAQLKRLAERVTVSEFVTVNPETKATVATTFTRAELLAVALNTGNTSNLEKMLIGETMALPEGLRVRHGWTEDRVMAVLDRELTREDWLFVEAVWRQINSLWPDIARSERDISGVAPEKIEGRLVETKYGTFQGGYYPMVYDPNRSQIAADNADDDAAKLFGGIGRTISTPKGHTITRTEAALPVHFSLERVLFNHINRVTTRIAYGRYARDVLKFAGHPKIRKLINQHIGPEYHGQIKGWLQRQVNDAALDTGMLSGIERVFRQVRVNATMVGLGLRFTTMAAQIGGWANSAAEIGPAWMARGMKETALGMGKIRSWVFDMSPEMAGRAEAFDRDVRTFYRDASRKLRGRRPGRTHKILDGISQASDALGLDKIRAGAFWGIGMIDVYLVAMPTWVGAYYKATESMGMNVADAIAFADKSVRKSQAAGRAKDLAAFQDSNEGYRQLTTFYSYFSILYNKQRETNVAFQRRDWRRVMTNVFWIMMVGPMAGALLTGDVPDEEDRDVEGWASWMASRFFFGLWSGVPVLRDVAAGLQREIEGKFTGAVEAPFYRMFSEVKKPVEDAIKVAKGEEPSDRWIKNTITPIGYFTGLPTGQVGQTAQYVADVAEGKQNPDSVGDVMMGVAKGPQDNQE